MKVNLAFACPTCGTSRLVKKTFREGKRVAFDYICDTDGTFFQCMPKSDGTIIAKVSFIIGHIVEE